jgi:hypothetical protein
MAILTGVTAISLWTKPDLADREFISVNSRQTDDSSFNPYFKILADVIPEGEKAALVIFPNALPAYDASNVGGVNSFLYDHIIRQSGVTRLDGQTLDLGQIREDKLIAQTLWNGFNKHLQVTDIVYSYPGSGVTITAPAETDILNPLQEVPLMTEVTIAGSPLFDVDIVISFVELDGVYAGAIRTYAFTVAGSRLAQKEFTFLSDANWDGGLSVTNRWLTSIFEASEVSETRQIIRSVPTREANYEFAAMGRDFVTAAWGYLQALAKRQTYMPLFEDVAIVTQEWDGGKIYCNTVRKRFYAGKTVVIALRRYDASYKEGTKNDTALYYTATMAQVDDDGIYLISSPLAEIPIGTTIYPGVLSEIAIEENTIETISGERSIINVSMDEVYGQLSLPPTNPLYSPVLFYGHPFFDFEWNWSSSPKMGVSRPADSKNSGRYQIVTPKTGFSQTSINILVSVHSREEWWDISGFFNYIKGRGRSFWLKSPLDALRKGIYTLYDGADLTELELIFWGGVNNLYSVQALWLKATDGTEVITKVTGLREAYGGGYIFEVDPVEIPDIIAVKQAFFVRNSKDEVKEHWMTSEGLVEYSLSLIELPEGYA